MTLSKKHWIILGFISVAVCGFLIYTNVLFPQVETSAQVGDDFPFAEKQESSSSTRDVSQKDSTSTQIVVDVKGEVQKPGVYELEAGLRVQDAVERASGITKEADMNQVNLATKVADEMVIYIPAIGQEPQVPVASGGSVEKSDSGVVNLNTATLEDLQTLNGIGPSKAQAILTYREENGPFKTVEDLLQVSGIGEKSLEKIKAEIAIN
ncbi:helix-hairpin-helix domain-containing protein [Priestia flexa]|uniref:helix-hairpin-helix domain-containing protein n=1 Tax=Priestia flexa TaxID=86664 RepID=UPI0009552B53|nr:helix-hairpin-helix domain-containing protein [Priestia flexa]MBY6085194.1 helix-hairpin-helix domain-containing protein [Priestia flexa]MCA1200716.1 helix-hairpin-helix domain-containing protein [Priestia flexa]MCM3064864.1 helix-hairpin-helix domain-containing protein [Priestia flexa]WEZ09478.1 helix-hairpin-helix domain-containing protein [Priestia flexa]WHX78475.1 helix-hairpin-helix domain-containing protein [Priestia flexa]